MRVANINQIHFLRGGVDRYFFALSDLLTHRGHEVAPFCAAHPQNEPSDWSDYFPAAVDFNRPGPVDLARYVFNPQAAAALKRLVRNFSPDVAHLHIYYGQLTASILPVLRQAGVPIVQTLHEYKLICPTYSLFNDGQVCERCPKGGFYQATITRCNRKSLARSALSTVESYVSRWLGNIDRVDHFIAVSDFVRQKMVEYGIAPDRITTVHNFIDCGSIPTSHAPGDYVLYLGRLERIKGLDTLLEAVAPLRHVRVLLVGDGADRDRLAREIEVRELTHVEMLGYRAGPELEALISGAICTVSPSECYETFGLTLIESFARARPVITSGMGGMAEVVADGIDGLVFEPGHAESLRQAIEWMVAHREEAAEMGRAGRAKVEAQFSASVHFEKLAQVYRGVGVAL
ncbi:glycosyltransferase family 4 protein [Nitrogeniibacter mangrovi]|uniref:Glycosyltransferase family 4 protein n=1 Tax=Nitrogeniibacter mangrovi TaxID=2016596 RepID=A0A6C1BA09_9RHOO|nr:glycosyltransferase family 4 protein [Nitrogeniibacter mangrovi]